MKPHQRGSLYQRAASETRETTEENESGRERSVRRAREHHFRDEISPAEYEALLEMTSDLVGTAHDFQHFVLGSYEPGEKEKLLHVKAKLHERADADCRGYLMDDFTDDLHPIVRFRLIADHSDSIVGVCEHDSGGFQVELGMLITFTRYFERSRLLKRSYADETEHYSWMSSSGVFEMFEYENRLWEWRTDEEFEAAVGDLLSDVV